MRLYLFELGRFWLPNQPQGIPVPGYLIETDAGQRILVDTGFPPTYSQEEAPLSAGPTPWVRPQQPIASQLTMLGLTPRDIDQVIVTHFDLDHAGNLALFSHAPIIVQREQYRVATSGHPRFVATRDQWASPLLNYRFVEGDVVLAPGVELIETSGHVAGHQSVLIHLPQTGPVLLAIDAILSGAMVDADSRAVDVSAEDDAGARVSTRKLAALVERVGVQLVIYGHDTEQWPTLKQAPLHYA